MSHKHQHVAPFLPLLSDDELIHCDRAPLSDSDTRKLQTCSERKRLKLMKRLLRKHDRAIQVA